MVDLPARLPFHGARTAPIVGRGRERALLRDRLDGAVAGRGGLILIGGEAGIGKTALAEALCAEAADQGVVVAVGRCYDLTETPPYGPWTEVFASLTADHDSARLPAPLGDGDVVASQAALFAVVRDHLVAATARQPLVLLLDDLHWADPASLDLLRTLARQVPGLPLLLLVTYRSDELSRRHPLYQLLPLLVREAQAIQLGLRPLPDEAVRELVRSRYALPPSDEDRLANYLRERTEGHPFFLGELLNTIEEAGDLDAAGGGWRLGNLGALRVPRLLRQVVEGRLARLPDEDQRLLAVAAVIGQEVPLVLWASVADVGEDALLETTERATRARLVDETEDGARARFVHALVREALYEGTLPSRRRAWHRRAGEALAATRSPDPDAVAHHLQQAGDTRAAEWLIKAADRALRAHAMLTAAERCEAALTLFHDDQAHARERGWLSFHVARLRRYEDPRRGLDFLAMASGLAAELGDAVMAAYAIAQRGMLLTILGETRRGIADLELGVAALEALPPGAAPGLPPIDRQTTLEYYRSQFVISLAGVGRYGKVLAATDRRVAVRAGAEANAERILEAPSRARGMAHAALGRPDRAQSEFADARAIISASWLHLVSASEAFWVVLPYQADRPAVRRALVAETNESLANAERGMQARWPQELRLLPILFVEGAWAEAYALADTLVTLMAERRAGLLERLMVGTAAELACERGDSDRVQWLLEEVLPHGQDTAPGDTEFVPALALQRLAAQRACETGDRTSARQWLAMHDRWLTWSGSVLGRSEGQLGWAAYHRAAGATAQARTHAQDSLACATEPRQPLALLAAHRLLGELATAASSRGDAATHLDAALVLADACAAPYERALTLLAIVELRAATGQQAAAHELLDEARALLEPLEARPALARADALRAKLAPDATPLYPAGLTAREVDVLRLVAQGLTDIQVAERLFVSANTVKTHLRSIFNKLEVTSRTAAARFATDHGLA